MESVIRFVREVPRVDLGPPQFRRALYESPVRFAPLPIEYNFMPYFPAYFMAEVKCSMGARAIG